jgi:drug/metabolite transporter (DMT)-like permease
MVDGRASNIPFHPPSPIRDSPYHAASFALSVAVQSNRSLVIKHPRIIGTLLCLLGIALTGAIPVFGRGLMNKGGVDAMLFTAVWLTWAMTISAITRPRGTIVGPPRVRVHWRFLVIIGVLHVGVGLVGFLSMQYVTAPTYAFIFTLAHPLAFAMGWLIQREQLHWPQVAGLLGATVGLVIFLATDNPGVFHPLGVALATVSAVCAALTDLAVKRKPADLPLWAIISSRAGLPGLLALIYTLATYRQPLPSAGAFGLIIAGATVGPFLGYLMLFWSLHYLPLTVMSVMRALTPVLATFYAWLIIGESIAWTQLPGAALIIVGVAIAPLSPDRVGEIVRRFTRTFADSSDNP